MSNALEVDNYKELLKHYIETQDEKSLYKAEQISKVLIQKNVLPEEIVNMHNQALAELYPDLFPDFQSSMNFLLETMIFYGLALQEYQTLRDKQLSIQSEIAVAADMQETFLATSKPSIEGLDIGVISVPAGQMNGDYYHFIKEENGSLGIALADVIGKGVPAALCMSMIKYAIDSFQRETTDPKVILETLNRVVERNVDSNMFITMFYAQYLPSMSKLLYSSAGHEPGFYYNAKEDSFQEIKTKGLVLGVLPSQTYKQYELTLEEGDMIVMLTDGVTECRRGQEFIESEEVLETIRKNKHIQAQELVNEVYTHFERIQNFQLRDDFTLIIIKKEV